MQRPLTSLFCKILVIVVWRVPIACATLSEVMKFRHNYEKQWQAHTELYFWYNGLQPRGGTDLERGYGDVRPWRPPFHASPAARKGPISSKRVSSQDPLLRKFGNFSLNSLNFHPNFSSQAPKFGNFQLTSAQIWKFSAHKPPNLEIFRSQAPLFRGKCQFASPTLRKSGPHTPTWKKVECPPPPPGVTTSLFGFPLIFEGLRLTHLPRPT